MTADDAGWGFADIYAMEDDRGSAQDELTDVKGDQWRNILVLGRATGRRVFPETLALVGHARYLADQLGCRVEVALIGQDLDAAVEDVKKYAVDSIYCVGAPDYAPIEHTAKALAQVVKKRRPELVLIFQSRSGDAITAYAASLLGVGHVIGATQVEMDTSERRAVVTHAGANPRFQVVTKMLQQPQFVSVQRGLFRTPLEDPYHATNVHRLDLDIGPVPTVEVVQRHDPPARTLENAERVVVAGSRIRDAADLDAARGLAEAMDAQFGVTQAVVDRGLGGEDAVVGGLARKVAPRVLLAVGCTGSLEFLGGLDGDPTIVAVAAGSDDPINDRAAFRVEGSVQDAVKEIRDAL